MSRPCEKCLKHISGSCSSWECKPETLEEHDKQIKEQTIDECLNLFAEWYGYNYENQSIYKLMKQMKGTENE